MTMVPNFSRRQIIFSVMILLIVFPATYGSAETDNGSPLSTDERLQLFERLEQVQSSLHSFQAEFIEERRVSGLSVAIRYQGHLYFLRDRLFFMRYTHPIHYVLCVRGNEALMFIEGSDTADIFTLSKASGVAGHASFLAWDPKSFKGEVRQTQDGYLFDHSPTGGTAGPALAFTLNKDTLTMKQLSIDNGNGDLTKITLSSAIINSPLPASVTLFELPAGVARNILNQP